MRGNDAQILTPPPQASGDPEVAVIAYVLLDVSSLPLLTFHTLNQPIASHRCNIQIHLM